MEDQPSSSRNHNAKLERNERERQRRMKMKNLYSRLASVIHPQLSKASVPELIDKATNHINHMHQRIESLKKQKEFYEIISDDSIMSLNPDHKRPMLDVQSWDSSTMKVNLICDSDNKSLVFEFFRIFQEEGAEVMNFTSHNVGDNIIYIMTAQATFPRIGIDTSRIHGRLKELIR